MISIKKSLFLAATLVATITFSSCEEGENNVDVTGIELNETSLEFDEGDEGITLTATVLPTNATNQSISWKSDNTNAVDVVGGLLIIKKVGRAKITVTTDEGKHTDFCEVVVNVAPVPVIGRASFKSDKTWTINEGATTQEWSDVVMASGARGKTTYDGGRSGNFKVDVRENGNYGDLFSWEAVHQYGDILCPGDWRVPSSQDFIDLDIALGGMGENVQFGAGDNYVDDTYFDAQVWGGVYGGSCNASGSLVNQGLTAYYWSRTTSPFVGDFAYALAVNTAMVYLDFGYDKGIGYMLRCIR